MKQPPGPRVNELGSSYESYYNDIEGAYAKMGNGTFSLLESRLSLRYLMRSRYTNKYVTFIIGKMELVITEIFYTFQVWRDRFPHFKRVSVQIWHHVYLAKGQHLHTEVWRGLY